MNKRLSDAISRLNELPEERQDAIAVLLLDYLDSEEADVALTPAQIAELDRRLKDNDFAGEDEANEFFGRLKA